MAGLKIQNFVFNFFNSSLNRVIYPKTNQYSPIFTFPNTFIHSCGLWHTLCIAIDGRVYAFSGNQFAQLGTGSDQGEVYN
jgi:alpha-tubulin suppressor-like RCC1 family protein